jgi:hypothetical protein
VPGTSVFELTNYDFSKLRTPFDSLIISFFVSFRLRTSGRVVQFFFFFSEEAMMTNCFSCFAFNSVVERGKE